MVFIASNHSWKFYKVFMRIGMEHQPINWYAFVYCVHGSPQIHLYNLDVNVWIDASLQFWHSNYKTN